MRRRLHLPPWRGLGMLGVSLGFVAFSCLWLLPSDSRLSTKIFAWAGTLMFGSGSLLAAANLLPSANYLELDENGFTTRLMWRKFRVRWDEVEKFFPYQEEGETLRQVAYLWKPPTSEAQARAREGTDDPPTLPENFGLRPEALAALLESCRLRAERT